MDPIETDQEASHTIKHLQNKFISLESKVRSFEGIRLSKLVIFKNHIITSELLGFFLSVGRRVFLIDFLHCSYQWVIPFLF
jgi:hypothetical protein